MTEPTELMPCPFCGGGARRMKHSAGLQGTTGHDQWHGVSCAACNACVGASDRRFRTPAEAIAAWNTRTPQPTQAQAGAVPLTDEEISDCAWGYFPDSKNLPEWVPHFVAAIEAAHGIGIKGGQHGAE